MANSVTKSVRRVVATCPRLAGKIRSRVIVGVILGLALTVGFACGASTSTSSSTSHSSPQASSSPTSGGGLDPKVSMPSGFPSDFPIYPGARLTSAGSFTSSGTTNWGVLWETADGADKVSAFYTTKLNQGDLMISFSGSANGTFTAIFNRKSNSKVAGLLGVDASRGFTIISLALTS